MTDNDIKLEFVREVLEKRGEKIMADMQEGIRFNQYEGTGHMAETLKFFVDRSNNSDGALHIEAVDYLRFQDIKASHKKKGAKKTGRRRRNIEDNQFTGQRKGFYTKSIYQHLTPIIWDLSFGLTKEVIDDIRERFSEYVVKK